MCVCVCVVCGVCVCVLVCERESTHVCACVCSYVRAVSCGLHHKMAIAITVVNTSEWGLWPTSISGKCEIFSFDLLNVWGVHFKYLR